jgi:hypothetical protein
MAYIDASQAAEGHKVPFAYGVEGTPAVGPAHTDFDDITASILRKITIVEQSHCIRGFSAARATNTKHITISRPPFQARNPQTIPMNGSTTQIFSPRMTIGSKHTATYTGTQCYQLCSSQQNALALPISNMKIDQHPSAYHTPHVHHAEA